MFLPRPASPKGGRCPFHLGRWIGVGNGERRPLPPNPVCGFCQRPTRCRMTDSANPCIKHGTQIGKTGIKPSLGAPCHRFACYPAPVAIYLTKTPTLVTALVVPTPPASMLISSLWPFATRDPP